MKIINQHNIDKWLFDYIEGNLSIDDTDVLIDFLNQNPSYYEELTNWQQTIGKNELPKYSYKNKETLLKSTPSYYRAIPLLILLFSISTFVILKSYNKPEYISAQYYTNDRVFNTDISQNQIEESNSEFITVKDESKGQNLIQNNSLTPNNYELASFEVENLDDRVPSIVSEGYKVNNKQIGIITKTLTDNKSKSIEEFNSAERFYSGLTTNHINHFEGMDYAHKALISRWNKSVIGNSSNSKTKRKGNKTRSKNKKRGLSIDFGRAGFVNLHDREYIISNSNILSLNGGLAGEKYLPNFELNSAYNEGIFKTTASYDQYFSAIKSGVGVKYSGAILDNQVFANQIGLVYAYKMQFAKKSSITPFIEANISQSIDNKLNLEEINPNVKMGFLFSSDNLYAGITYNAWSDKLRDDISESNELNKIDINTPENNLRVLFGFDYKRSVIASWSYSPHIVLDVNEKNTNAWISASAKCDNVILGLGVNTLQKLRTTFGVGSKYFKVMYSYNISNNNSDDLFSGQMHEIQFNLLLRNTYKVYRPRKK